MVQVLTLAFLFSPKLKLIQLKKIRLASLGLYIGLESTCCTDTVYRVEKQNLQVAKLVNFEHVNENMAQNSSPTSKHNLFALIQSKKLLVKCLGI